MAGWCPRSRGRGSAKPTGPDRGEVLEGGDVGEAAVEPPPFQRRREESSGHRPAFWTRSSESVGVGLGVDALLGQMVQHHLVRPRVPGLLLNERFDGRLQVGIVDERRRLEYGFDEVPLALGQKKMQNIHHVGRERVIGNPVQRQIRPIESHLPAKRRVSVMTQFHFRHRSSPSLAPCDRPHFLR